MRALAILCLLVATAHADDPHLAAARKLLDKQLADSVELLVGIPMATPSVATFPGHLIDGEMQSWKFGPPYIGKIGIVNTVGGWSGDWGWIAADLAVTQTPYTDSSAGGPARSESHRYHLLQVYALDKGALSVRATQLIDTRADDKLQHFEPRGGGSPQKGSLLWNLISPGQLTLAADANVAVMGTSASETGLGAAAAKKLLASWKKLELSLVGTPKEVVVGDLGIGVSEVDLMLRGKTVRLRGTVVARKAGKGWEVIALSYGSDSDFGDPKH